MVTESLSFILIYGLVFSIFIKGLDRCFVEKLDDGIPTEGKPRHLLSNCHGGQNCTTDCPELIVQIVLAFKDGALFYEESIQVNHRHGGHGFGKHGQIGSKMTLCHSAKPVQFLFACRLRDWKLKRQRSFIVSRTQNNGIVCNELVMFSDDNGNSTVDVFTVQNCVEQNRRWCGIKKVDSLFSRIS